jgi:hypothetical protein
MVNKVLIESLEKADKKKKMAKKHSLKNIENMNKSYNAASAFTTLMSKLLDKSVGYEDFEEMNQDMLHQVNLTTEENPTVENKQKSSDSNSSEDEDPPPPKKRKSSLLSVHKTHEEDSDNEIADIVEVDNSDEDDDDDEEEEDN